ncbi:MAG: type II toxin-antitoxin system HicB family antitoxin [Candidatus Kapabacteria bacterium]|nr:type II toxin-antitoxin system HicB family antitoxin [Candidatus Kapabacteria bacterium]
MKPYFTAIIEKEDDMFVSLCPEVDIASQGKTIEEAKSNLKEAVELFLEHASVSELSQRLHYEVFISPLEVSVG